MLLQLLHYPRHPFFATETLVLDHLLTNTRPDLRIKEKLQATLYVHLQVGDTIDLEVLRGSSLIHVQVLLEPNTTMPQATQVIIMEPKSGGLIPVPP